MSDGNPSLTVLGIYRVPADPHDFIEDLRHFYFPGNAVRDTNTEIYAFIERCVPLVLFDTRLERLDERFRIEEITQDMPGAPRKAWQVPYGEAILSADGLQVVSRKIGCTRGLKEGRLAFYFHYYDPTKPMLWSYGQFSTPPVQVVPQRLWEMVPYSPV